MHQQISFQRPVPLPVRDLAGKVYGPFRLVELIGAGGMGAVYRAERIGGVPQILAVKVINGEMTATATARFVREAKLLARLEHPAIARFVDTGAKDGERWIALEFVRGQSIEQYCDDHGLGIAERVDLLIRLLPPGNVTLRITEVGRGTCLARLGRDTEAEALLVPAAAALEAARGPHHRATQQAYRALRDLYNTMGRSDEAARWGAKVRQSAAGGSEPVI
jgi:hypothetical protein